MKIVHSMIRRLRGIETLTNQRMANELIKNRMAFILVVALIACAGLIIRIAYLEIVQYKKYHLLSYKNQITLQPQPPIRGLIYDRTGKLLAQNESVYNLEIIPEKVKSLNDTFERLQALLTKVQPSDIAKFQRIRHQYHKFESIPFVFKLNNEEAALFAVNQYAFPGVLLKPALIRTYPLKETYAHILGYVGRINSHDIKNIDKRNYYGTNFIGKLGIEHFYESTLHGKIGLIEAESDASGRIQRIIHQKKAESGQHLFLTIDSNLQQATQAAFKNTQGAAVAIDPNNGEILAMVSAPSYDPNPFVNGISQTSYSALTQSKAQPLFNRAIKGQYPLASTIKPFLSVAALSRGIVHQNYAIFDPGWFKLPNNNHKYRDWKRSGHGWIAIERAIVVSCDTYFYKLAELMGINLINDVLNQFGFGHLTHVDLSDELPGLIPTPQWKRSHRKTSWFTGDTLISGIGQGFMLTTPLQLANATAAFANKGRHFRPHLVLKQYDPNTNKYNTIKPIEEYPIHFDESSWKQVFKALSEVVSSREGTGFRFGRNTPYTIAAKTGTAQVISLRSHKMNTPYESIPKHLRDHSLFIGFAPVDKPKIALAVVVENDKHASAIARKIMDAYLTNIKS